LLGDAVTHPLMACHIRRHSGHVYLRGAGASQRRDKTANWMNWVFCNRMARVGSEQLRVMLTILAGRQCKTSILYPLKRSPHHIIKQEGTFPSGVKLTLYLACASGGYLILSVCRNLYLLCGLLPDPRSLLCILVGLVISGFKIIAWGGIRLLYS
jgi:hypothetical protein